MKVWKKQKGLLVRTMICAVSLAAACFYGNSLPAQAAPRAQETGERVVIVIDPGHGGDNEGTLEGPAQEKKMTMVTANGFAVEDTPLEEIYTVIFRDWNEELQKNVQVDEQQIGRAHV